MEPITALGAAAAGLQLVDVAARALMGAVGLARNLRDAPARTEKLLVDVDRSVAQILHISATLLQPGSRFCDALSPDQVTRLSTCASQTGDAMDALRILLVSLCGAGHPGSSRGKAILQRAWSAVIAAHKQDEVSELLARAERLNLDMIRELELIGLEMQAGSGVLSNTILTAVNESRSAVLTRLDHFDVANQEVQTTLQRNHSLTVTRFDSLKQSSLDTQAYIKDGQSLIVQKLDSVACMNAEIQTETQRSRLESARTLEGIDSIGSQVESIAVGTMVLRQRHADVHSELSRLRADTHLHTREIQADIAALTNNFASLLTGGIASMIRQELSQQAALLSPQETAEMEHGVRRQLARYPASLRNAHERTRLAHRRFRSCTCRPSTHRRGSRYWRLEFAYAAESNHRLDCPLYSSGYRSWSYSLKAQLFPFLHQTVELALGTTSGAGRWSIVPPLRFRGTVRRVDSPIFRAFDNLVATCSAKSRTKRITPSHGLIIYDQERERVDLIWDKQTTIINLEQVIVDISEAVTLGAASGGDLDEDGNSFLLVSYFTRLTPLSLTPSRKYSRLPS